MAAADVGSCLLEVLCVAGSQALVGLVRTTLVEPAIALYEAQRAVVVLQIARLDILIAPLQLAKSALVSGTQLVGAASAILPLDAFNRASCLPAAELAAFLNGLNIGTIVAAANAQLDELASLLSVRDNLEFVLADIDRALAGLRDILAALEVGVCPDFSGGV